MQYKIDLDNSNEAEILELNMNRQKNKENVAPSLEKSSKSAGRLEYKWTTSLGITLTSNKGQCYVLGGRFWKRFKWLDT